MNAMKFHLTWAVLAVVIVAVAPLADARLWPAGFYLHHLRSARGKFSSAVCIPQTTQVFEDHEGRHLCAYNHTAGFRAVGVGYNLDDDVDARKIELAAVFADYDKVYSRESCLIDLQVSTLLAVDAQRSLIVAAQHVKPLDDFCCNIQAVFADVVHSLGGTQFPAKEFEAFTEKAAVNEWSNAAKELEKTMWCDENGKRCADNLKYVKDGCNSVLKQFG